MNNPSKVTILVGLPGGNEFLFHLCKQEVADIYGKHKEHHDGAALKLAVPSTQPLHLPLLTLGIGDLTPVEVINTKTGNTAFYTVNSLIYEETHPG